jgi:uncharacterized protein (DUF58 family)
MRAPPESFNDPELFLAIEDLELAARVIVEGTMLGVHRSPFLGLSGEFEAHREYHVGDDLRHVNWNLWARTDQMFVKQFRSDTNLQLYLALDASGSMATASGPSRKWAYGARMAAALAFLALSCRDATGLALLRSGVFAHVPARVDQGQLQRILTALESTAPRGRADVTLALEEVVHLCARRGIVAYFGDLFDSEAQMLLALATLRCRGHEVVVFHVLDPWELELPEQGVWEFSDLETGDKLEVNAPAVSGSYRAVVAGWRQGLQERCAAEGISYFLCRTDWPLKEALLRFFAARPRGI